MENVFHAKLRYSAPRSEGVIMHGELQIEQAVIMFVDATDEYAPRPAGIFYMWKVQMKFLAGLWQQVPPLLTELADRPYGRGGGFGDEWGNKWWVNTPLT